MANRGERKDDKDPEKSDGSMFDVVADAVVDFIREHGAGKALSDRGKNVDEYVDEPQRKKKK